MPAPTINISLINPGGSGAAPSTEQVPIFVGTAESGTIGVVQEFGSLALVKAEFTRGHLVNVAAVAFARGMDSVKLLRETGSVAAVTSSVTQAGSGGTVTIGGTISEELDCKIVMVTGGDLGEATFRYTLDDFAESGVEATYSEVITVPVGGVYTFPGTAMTATFDDDPTPLAAGDTFSWTTSPAYYGATEVADVTDAVQEPIAGDATFIVYTGTAATASAANTVGAAVAAQVNTLYESAYFMAALMGGGRGTAAELITATASLVSSPPFLGVMYGRAFVPNPVRQAGRGFIAVHAHEVAAIKIASDLISTDPGRRADLALPGVTGVEYDARLQGNSLYNARIGALTSVHPRLSGGYFIQRVRLLDATVGDFVSWQDAAVMIVAMRAVHRVAFLQILELFRTNPNGTMDARDRATLKSTAETALSNVLLTPLNVRGFQGHVSDLSATVVPTTQLPTIDIQVAIRRLGYGETINFTLRYAGEF